MSGISKSFKLPTLSVAKRRKVAHGLPTFNWKDVKNLQPLAVGKLWLCVLCELCLSRGRQEGGRKKVARRIK